MGPEISLPRSRDISSAGFARLVDWYIGTNVLEEHEAPSARHSSWKEEFPLKLWYLSAHTASHYEIA